MCIYSFEHYTTTYMPKKCLDPIQSSNGFIHLQNLIVYVEIHILHKEHLREEARESCSAEDRRGFEDGLPTKHGRRLALLTRLKPKQKQKGRRNVTTLGNMH